MKKEILVFLLYIMTVAVASSQIAWPDGKKAAVVLTYDDGLKSQREIVAPQLEAKGFRGTFFLYGIALKTEDIDLWREMAKRGHEIGNHSLFHPCLSKTVESDSKPCRSLECYSIKDILNEIKTMNAFLYAIDGKKTRTYAYPCNQTMTAEGDYADLLGQSGLVKYGRGASTQEIILNTNFISRYQMPTYSVKPGAKADSIINRVKETIEIGGLTIFVFHGVGGDYLAVNAEEHQKLVDYLATHSKDVWVGTFLEVMDYIYQK